MKEFAFQLKKKLTAFLALSLRKIKRTFVPAKLSKEQSFNIPIVINNRNRLTYLKDLVTWLQKAGYRNIIILDNDSTFPGLKEYYDECGARIIYLKKNLGYKALWLSDFFNEIRSGFYVYSDPDLMPVAKCPDDLVYRLAQVLRKYPVEKCGPALKIDDLPAHYRHKQKVLHNEDPFWKNRLEENVFYAPIDTTFALYKPFAYGDAEECSAVRVGGDLCMVHRPWYENSNEPDEETKYYVQHAGDSSSWYKKVK
jgi:hypothetical protein